MISKDEHKANIKRKFIDLTIDLVQKDGMDGVSIRKIASIAKYNSATIYLYFDNLDHLLFLASVSCIRDYIDELLKIGNKKEDSYDKFINIWKCFIHYSFKKPRIFNHIFFVTSYQKTAQYLEEYYELYPEKVEDVDNIAYKFIFKPDLHERVGVILKHCEEDGYFEKNDLNDITELSLFIYRGMLDKLIKGEFENESMESVEAKTLAYIEKMLHTYKKK